MKIRATLFSSLLGGLLLLPAALPSAGYGADLAGGKPDPAVVAGAAQLLDEALTLLATKTSDTDTKFYDNGLWRYKDSDKSWKCNGGPGVAAAILWKWREQNPPAAGETVKASQAWLRQVAVESFDRILKDKQNPDGSMGPAQAGEDFHFFSRDLGLAYLVLKDSLDDATRRRWSDALVLEVEYLIRHGELPNPDQAGWKATDGWTTNGNFEVCETEILWLVWKVTGKERYKAIFETQWQHTLAPSQARWKGYGLFYLKNPAREDGGDGAAYLAEAEQEPGFDRDYTQLQLSFATRLYVESRDPRVLRLVNLLVNALLPHVDESTWILDATYGSRHSLHMPFCSAGLAVAAWFGNRPDLVPKVTGQFANGMRPMYLNNATQERGNPYAYRGYGSDVAGLLLAAMPALGN